MGARKHNAVLITCDGVGYYVRGNYSLDPSKAEMMPLHCAGSELIRSEIYFEEMEVLDEDSTHTFGARDWSRGADGRLLCRDCRSESKHETEAGARKVYYDAHKGNLIRKIDRCQGEIAECQEYLQKLEELYGEGKNVDKAKV